MTPSKTIDDMISAADPYFKRVQIETKLKRFTKLVNDNEPSAVRWLEIFREPGPISVDRLGQTPIIFVGSLIRECSTQLIDTLPEKPNDDWFHVRMFRIDQNSEPNCLFPFVVSIVYTTVLKKVASSRPYAWLETDPIKLLTNFDPLEYLRGYPDLPKYDTMQAALEDRISIHWQKLVTELLRDPL